MKVPAYKLELNNYYVIDGKIFLFTVDQNSYSGGEPCFMNISNNEEIYYEEETKYYETYTGSINIVDGKIKQ